MENTKGKRKERSFNTDLAIERHRADTALDGVSYRREGAVIGYFERLCVTTSEGADSIGRPVGLYDTLTLPRLDTLGIGEREDAVECVARELCRICDKRGIIPERILVIGLGNPNLTPDAVGPKTVEGVIPTLQYREGGDEVLELFDCSEIAVLSPLVSSLSGIESVDIVASVAKKVNPTLVICVDALAARSPKRLGSTLQFCDTGIHQGSGIGKCERGITEDLLGVPVIAIGVPTVIDARLLIEGENDTATEGMLVSPREIDEIVAAAAYIISGGINQAFGLAY